MPALRFRRRDQTQPAAPVSWHQGTPKRVFLVQFTGDSTQEPLRRLKERYRAETDHYGLSDECYLVCSGGTAKDLADRIGLTGEDPAGPTGVVLQLKSFYAGFEQRALWDWLQEAEENARLPTRH